MKNLLKLLVPFVAVLTFLSCEKQPTELKLGSENSARNAKIIGTLTYSKGQDPATFADLLVPAEGKKVFVDVPLLYYSTTNPVGAIKRFETTVDSEGKFTLEIPVTGAPLAGTTLQVEDFVGEHNFFEEYVQEGDSYKAKFVSKEALYQIAPLPLGTLSDGKIISVANLTYTFSAIGLEPEYKFMSVLTFDCIMSQEKVVKTGTIYNIIDTIVKAVNTDVIVAIERTVAPYEVEYYIAKSNDTGLVTLNIPLKNITETINITVSSNLSKGTFKHYQYIDSDNEVEPAVYDLTGYFSAYTPLTINNVPVGLKYYEKTHLSNKFRLSFTPSPSDQPGADSF